MNTQKLKQKLYEENISPAEFSRIIGISQSKMSRILSGGNFYVEDLEKFCSYFKCQPSDLISFDSEPVLQKPIPPSEIEFSYKSSEIKDFSKLRSYLESRNITPYRLSKVIGKSTTLVYNVLDGKRSPKWESVRKIMDFLECDLDAICTLNCSSCEKQES